MQRRVVDKVDDDAVLLLLEEVLLLRVSIGAALVVGVLRIARRVGDKVMQVRNDYDKQVFNGDIGFIQSISATEQTLTIDFDGTNGVLTLA